MVSNVVVVVVVVADVAGAAATALRVDNATVTALGGGGSRGIERQIYRLSR